MRRVVALCVVAVAFAVTGASSGAENARLVLRDRTPLTLDGMGFGAETRVAFVVRTPTLEIRRAVRANANGRLRVVFARVSLAGALRCAYGVSVVARAGDEVVLWRPPKLPDCASPSRPPA